jgi:hypothetical protein
MEQAVDSLLRHRVFGIPTPLPLGLLTVVLGCMVYRWRRSLHSFVDQLRRLARIAPVLGRAGIVRPQLEVYRRLEAVLRQLGLQRWPTQTPYEFLLVVEPQLAARLGGATVLGTPRRVIDAYYRFRYGDQSLADAEHRRLLDEVAELERTLRSAATAKDLSLS